MCETEYPLYTYYNLFIAFIITSIFRREERLVQIKIAQVSNTSSK